MSSSEPASTRDGPEGRSDRPRGGYRRELRTIPENVVEVRAPASMGTPVNVMANFVATSVHLHKEYYQYRADFNPIVESKRLRRIIFQKATENLFPKGTVEFDGVSDALSGNPMVDGITAHEGEYPHPSVPGSNITFTLKFVGTFEDTPTSMMRVYNIHMKSFMRRLGFFAINSTGTQVHPELTTPIGQGHNLLIVRGFNTSANIHEGNKMLMQLEACHKIMQRDNVLVLMTKIRNECQARGEDFKERIKAFILGKLVVTSYKKVVYRVEDVDFDKNAQSTFECSREKEPISFHQYFLKKHNVEIKTKMQPLLLVIPNSRKRFTQDSQEGQQDIYVVPELCNLAGLTEEQRNDNKLKIELIRTSQVSPEDRVKHLRTFLAKFHDNKDVLERLDQLGYAYEKDLVKIRGRVLETQRVGLRESQRTRPDVWPQVGPRDGSFESVAMKEQIAVDKPVEKLAIIIARPDFGAQADIFRYLREGLKRVGLTVGPPKVIRIEDGDHASKFERELRNLPGDAEAAIVILSRQMKDKYDAIKKFASIERGLITQVVTARLLTDQRKAQGAATKIGIQLAAKVGAEPWYVTIPLKSAMICGFDTHRDTVDRNLNWAAFVASMNSTYTRWWSTAKPQRGPEESGGQARDNITEALLKWKAANEDRWPQRVYIYRDGVSDGQLQHVFEVEVREIKEAMFELSDSIHLTVVVVNKRVGARFFASTGTGGFQNCIPGTVIDDVVTRQERYDFYLISQSTRHGTVAPTYYNIIHDESGLKPFHHQLLAFKLCFMYFNWAGTVRVPAPCQYAHKLAFLCAEHLHSSSNPILDDRLHYL